MRICEFFFLRYSYIKGTLCSLAEEDSERCAWLPEGQGAGDDWKQGHEAKKPRPGQQLSRPHVKLSVYTGITPSLHNMLESESLVM